MTDSTLRMAGAAALAAALALAQPATAAPIAYSESVGGDLFLTQVGTLEIGLNTIAGSLCYRCGDDSDWFSVYLGAGLRITDIAITATNFSSGGGARFYAVPGSNSEGVALDAATGDFVLAFQGNLSQTSVFSGAADGPGDLVLYQTGTTFTTPTSYDYVVGITVEAIPTTAVPEPASLALAIAALFGLAASCRRRAA